jgi:hypothetical protein
MSVQARSVRPQLLDSVLDPDKLTRKLDSLKAEREDEKYAEVPPEQRLPPGHLETLREEITEEQAEPERTIRASGPPPAGVSAPPSVIYLSRKPNVSQFMSVITHCFEEELATPAFERLRHVGALDELWRDVERFTEDLRSRFRQFGPCDIRFLEPVLAQALAGFLGRHAFSADPPGVRLAEQEHLGQMHRLQQALADHYGPDAASKFSSGNALRVIRATWQRHL